MTATPDSRQALRKTIRQKRRSLSPAEQANAAAQVCSMIIDSYAYRESQHIALFLAADGEIDLTGIFSQARKDGKQCYLPVCLHDTCTLEFYAWFPGDDLTGTPLGVHEPSGQSQQIAPSALDLVLTPLVAFDKNCQRMGMGKGFYDRTFAYKSRHNQKNISENAKNSPILLGIAHECQRVENLETAWWDVPLDAVITPSRCYGKLKTV